MILVLYIYIWYFPSILYQTGTRKQRIAFDVSVLFGAKTYVPGVNYFGKLPGQAN